MNDELDPAQFPHPPRGAGGLRTTVENVEYLLDRSRVTVGWDVIKKRLIAQRDGRPCSLIEIVSLATRNGLYGSWLQSFVTEIATRNPHNPVKAWIDSKPWDQRDRLPDLFATVRTAEDYPLALKETLLHRWLLSAAAAALLEGKRFSTRGVLTFQGPQGAGKTSWIVNLLPEGAMRADWIKRDHHLDGGSKDSILGGISHWITEIGELDSSFRKDVARLKGFLTNDCDKVRPPYGRVEVEFDRRTVFAATVNEAEFLVDQTGNTRFWTIAVERLVFDHGIDMQQVFAQLAAEFRAGAQWWLTAAEEEALAAYNLRHRAINAVAERVKEFINPEPPEGMQGIYMTAIQVLHEIGINQPSNVQCRDCGAALRELYGPPKRVHGRDQWRVFKASWSKPNPASLATAPGAVF